MLFDIWDPSPPPPICIFIFLLRRCAQLNHIIHRKIRRKKKITTALKIESERALRSRTRRRARARHKTLQRWCVRLSFIFFYARYFFCSSAREKFTCRKERFAFYWKHNQRAIFFQQNLLGFNEKQISICNIQYGILWNRKCTSSKKTLNLPASMCSTFYTSFLTECFLLWRNNLSFFFYRGWLFERLEFGLFVFSQQHNLLYDAQVTHITFTIGWKEIVEIKKL